MAGYGYGHGYGYGAGRPVRNPIPPGWLECPPIGEVSDVHTMIPMKVPLGPSYKVPNMALLSQNAWTPEMAAHAAHEKIVAKNPQGVLGMVLDLTNSDKYYDPDVFRQLGLRYVKVPCRGRGQSPDPLAVNMAAWEVRKSLALNPQCYILVHCTHGFNRSGFVIVSVAMRLLAEQGFCVERLLRRFVEQRKPGIYKDEYIDDLFRRHNELRPKVVRTPPLPAWKPADDEDEDPAGYHSSAAKAPAARLTHSDKVGEPVCVEETRYILCMTYDVLQGQDLLQKGQALNGFPHEQLAARGASPGDFFIGSQPVSLDADNLGMVRLKRYFVTWKADGTRYMMFVTRWGTYLIDRAGEVRRVHMRFPTLLPPDKKSSYPVGPPHDFTLLDGEMVVDDLDHEGLQQRRRYLVYDLMLLAGEGVSDLRFQDRYKLTSKEVVRPRDIEQKFYNARRKDFPTFLYDWGLEEFSVRQKEFWPLNKAGKLLEAFIPTLCHESDGLILQPWDDPYIPRTYPHLLKWKFRHMNSVDFKLSSMGQTVSLQLNCAMRRKRGQADINHLSLQDIGLGEQRVEFPEGVDPRTLHAKIIECSFDVERRVWLYMRERPDKLTANHRSVFEKVMTSISDNITEERLLDVFNDALQSNIYAEERQWLTQATHTPTDAPKQPPPAAVASHQPHNGQPPPEQHHAQQQQQPPNVQQLQQPAPQREQQQQGQAQLAVRQALQQRLQQQQQQHRGPSPILTPPPGATAGDEGGLQQQNGLSLAAAAAAAGGGVEHGDAGQDEQQEQVTAGGACYYGAGGPADETMHSHSQQQQQQYDEGLHDGAGGGQHQEEEQQLLREEQEPEHDDAADHMGDVDAANDDGDVLADEEGQQQEEEDEQGDDDYKVTEMDAEDGSEGVEEEEI